jgi:hypothetical protein
MHCIGSRRIPRGRPLSSDSIFRDPASRDWKSTVLGQLVRVLLSREMDAGRYSPVWDGRDAAGVAVTPGVYFVRLEAGRFSAARKVVRVD